MFRQTIIKEIKKNPVKINIASYDLYLLRPLTLQKSPWKKKKKSCYKQKKEEEGGERKGFSFFLSLFLECAVSLPLLCNTTWFILFLFFSSRKKLIYMTSVTTLNRVLTWYDITFPSLPPFTFCRVYKICFWVFLMMMMMREKEKN